MIGAQKILHPHRSRDDAKSRPADSTAWREGGSSRRKRVPHQGAREADQEKLPKQLQAPLTRRPPKAGSQKSPDSVSISRKRLPPAPPLPGMDRGRPASSPKRPRTSQRHSRPEPPPSPRRRLPPGPRLCCRPRHPLHQQPGRTGPPDDQSAPEGLRRLPHPKRIPPLPHRQERHRNP